MAGRPHSAEEFRNAFQSDPEIARGRWRTHQNPNQSSSSDRANANTPPIRIGVARRQFGIEPLATLHACSQKRSSVASYRSIGWARGAVVRVSGEDENLPSPWVRGEIHGSLHWLGMGTSDPRLPLITGAIFPVKLPEVSETPILCKNAPRGDPGRAVKQPHRPRKP